MNLWSANWKFKSTYFAVIRLIAWARQFQTHWSGRLGYGELFSEAEKMGRGILIVGLERTVVMYTYSTRCITSREPIPPNSSKCGPGSRYSTGTYLDRASSLVELGPPFAKVSAISQ